MRFVVLAYTKEADWSSLSASEQTNQIQKFGAFIQEIEQRGVRELNARLQASSSAVTVHMKDNVYVREDGPYATTKEQITGIYILNCKDFDEAIELAEKLPASSMGFVEIRPIADT